MFVARSVALRARPAAYRRLITTSAFKLQQNNKNSPLLDNEKEYTFKKVPPELIQQARESEYATNKRIERVERIKAVIYGALILVGALGAFEAYQNRARLKYWLFNEYDLSGFGASYDKMTKPQKSSKKSKAELNVFKPTNPNTSDVPGLYIVGNNENKQLVNEDAKVISHFKRHSWFDDKLLRQVRIGDTSSLAIDSNGDLIQWGNGFAKDSDPQYSLKGQSLTSAELSNGVLYCLTKKGELIYLPEQKELQDSFNKASFLGLRSSSFKNIDNGDGVKFKDIKAGKQHLLLLSKDSKIYTMATGLAELKESKGQFGLPQYSQFDKPPAPNQLIELTNINFFKDNKTGTIKKRDFQSIASGDFHNLCLDDFGSVWSWGVNTFGSAGHVINYNSEVIPIPKKIELNRSYFKRNELPQCFQISAGGYSSFGSFRSSNIYSIFEDYVKAHDGDLSQMTDDLQNSSSENVLHLGWGKCLSGQLGIGHYVHCQNDPIKLKNLSNLKFYNEVSGRIESIGLKDLSVGSKHSIITLSNNDVLTFGDNEFCQLGNGKKVKNASPVNIPRLIEPESQKSSSTLEGTAPLGSKYQRINDRLQLKDTGFHNTRNKKLSKKIEQKIYAGHEASAIYYTCTY